MRNKRNGINKGMGFRIKRYALGPFLPGMETVHPGLVRSKSD